MALRERKAYNQQRGARCCGCRGNTVRRTEVNIAAPARAVTVMRKVCVARLPANGRRLL
jgi:hypothetical protein